MILKRKEKDNVIKAMYNSSNIIASVYDKNTNDLILIFNKGTQYKYEKVSNTDYTRFELAESQGKVFSSHIKSYPTTRLEDTDPKLILNEVNNLKEVEKKAALKFRQKTIIDVMKGLISTDEQNILFTEDHFLPLQNSVLEYLNELNKKAE